MCPILSATGNRTMLRQAKPYGGWWSAMRLGVQPVIYGIPAPPVRGGRYWCASTGTSGRNCRYYEGHMCSK